MNSYKYFLKLIMSQQIHVSVDSTCCFQEHYSLDKGRKSICVTVSLRTYMYAQLIYLHFGY